jgi:hypothetical protein
MAQEISLSRGGEMSDPQVIVALLAISLALVLPLWFWARAMKHILTPNPPEPRVPPSPKAIDVLNREEARREFDRLRYVASGPGRWKLERTEDKPNG